MVRTGREFQFDDMRLGDGVGDRIRHQPQHLGSRAEEAGDAANEGMFAFGPFRLLTPQRTLLKGDKRLHLGSRALDLLFILVERAGDLVAKDELTAHVWPNSCVEEATLRVHVASLRRVLGDGRSGARYVENVSGRGYRFVAPVKRLQQRSGTVAKDGEAAPNLSMPVPLGRIVGRDQIMADLANRLAQHRFLTIAGPGGIGKTTVALGIARLIATDYRDGAGFVDLASLADPQALPNAVAAALHITPLSEHPLRGLISVLKDRQMLLVLDNCEHVVEASAMFVESLLKGAPRVAVIVTSREQLRAEGEWVQRLSPLAAPSATASLSVAEAMTYPAIELFVERALAKTSGFALAKADLPIIADLCRRLDGSPLAIELAAARLDVFGVHGLTQHLDGQLQLLTGGRRTGPTRHLTLRATLDWSYQLLSVRERAILRRLSVFAGSFDASSAAAVACDRVTTPTDLMDVIANLAAKSLIIADTLDNRIQYRLLNTLRDYAREKLKECGEDAEVRRRHALHCCRWGAEARHAASSLAKRRATLSSRIDDVQAALEWCFSSEGDVGLGVRLTASSAPLWFHRSLLDTCRTRCAQAWTALENAAHIDGPLELQFDLALGEALLHNQGPCLDVRAAFLQASGTKRPDGGAGLWRVHWGQWLECTITADYGRALELAAGFYEAFGRGDHKAAVVAERVLGSACHFAGDQPAARRHVEAALHAAGGQALDDEQGDFMILRARTVLSRILWLQGLSDQARQVAEQVVDECLASDNAVALCYSLSNACAVALWLGDDRLARRHMTMLRDHAAEHTLVYWQAWAGCYRLALCQRQGQADEDAFRAFKENLLCGPLHLDFLATFNHRLAEQGAIARAELLGAHWCSAELLRVKGELLLERRGPEALDEAGRLFCRALEISRRQGAQAWELRAATSLALLASSTAGAKRRRQAHQDLDRVLSCFTEGATSADVACATKALQALAG